MKFFSDIKKYMFDKNPVFIRAIGILPALAVTSNMKNAFFMAALVVATLVISCFILSLIKVFLDEKIRLISALVVFSTVVSVLHMAAQAFYPLLDMSLGFFIPLIAVDTVVISTASSFEKKKLSANIAESIGTGIGFSFAVILVGTLREILGAGTILGNTRFAIKLPLYTPIRVFVLPAGAFIAASFIAALFKANADINKRKGKNK